MTTKRRRPSQQFRRRAAGEPRNAPQAGHPADSQDACVTLTKARQELANTCRNLLRRNSPLIYSALRFPKTGERTI